jgi:hypothetical protein
MINMYMQKYLLNTTGRAKTIKVVGVEDTHIQVIVIIIDLLYTRMYLYICKLFSASVQVVTVMNP